MLLLLTGCGDLPQPFLGNPGVVGRRLAQPPPARLAVPTPKESLLSDSAGDAWAKATAAALVAQELPAVPGDEARRGDWKLVLSADMRGAQIFPSYTVIDPKGQSKGVSEGPPIAVEAWSEASAATIQKAADGAVPGVSALLSRIEAARRAADPNDLLNRAAKLYFTGVTGAPGDGNTALANQIRTKLSGLGQLTQDSSKDADFVLKGEVHTGPGAQGALQVEIQWIVTDAKGEERGRVVQINDVPAGTLDHYWGDVAVVVAEEAAGGVRDVLANQTGRKAPAAS